MICSDCSSTVHNIGPRALAKGSAIREPGEALCMSCTSTRNLMVRELAKIPKTLRLIQDKRRVRA